MKLHPAKREVFLQPKAVGEQNMPELPRNIGIKFYISYTEKIFQLQGYSQIPTLNSDSLKIFWDIVEQILALNRSNIERILENQVD